jgi:glutamate-1-semialdehyde 2,1-aminomutase
MIAPAGPVYQAGTLSGNPLAMVAGIATLSTIGQPGIYDQLEQMTTTLSRGFQDAAQAAGIPLQVAAAGSMWGFFFADAPVTDYASAKRADTARYARFFHAMLDHGVYLAPSQFETAFVSLAHDDALIAQTLEAATQAFKEL